VLPEAAGMIPESGRRIFGLTCTLTCLRCTTYRKSRQACTAAPPPHGRDCTPGFRNSRSAMVLHPAA